MLGREGTALLLVLAVGWAGWVGWGGVHVSIRELAEALVVADRMAAAPPPRARQRTAHGTRIRMADPF